MKKVYFLPSSLDVNKVGPILEQLYVDISDNDQISLIICDKVMNTCSLNLNKNPLVCLSCVKNVDRIVSKFDIFQNVSVYRLSDFAIEVKLEFNEAEERDLEYYNNLTWDENKYDVGSAVVSTFVSHKRDISNIITKKEQKILFQYYLDSIRLYESFNNFINIYNPDEIIIFNGRLFDTRPVLRLCQSKAITCSVIEICGYKQKNWIKFTNTLPHDIDEYIKNVENTWNSEPNYEFKHITGTKFFILRSEGKKTNDKSYVQRQNPNLLPEDFNKNKKNITIFNSSEDEFFSLGSQWKKIYNSQTDGIKYVCKLVEDKPKYHVYLRIHPNLATVDADFVKELYLLENEFKNLTVINPNSSVSSYHLMMQSDKILTFGSTMGIEATFFGKPSLSLGSSFYNKIDGAYYITKPDDPIISTFLFNDLQPKSKENAVKYGYYQMNAGTQFKYWENNLFNSVNIPRPSIFEKIFYHIYGKFKK